MKSVRKMVMIPYDQYERWKSSKEENAQVNYTSFTESSTKDKDESKEPQQNNDMHTYSNEEDMPEDMILMGMPKAFYRKAKSLLQHIFFITICVHFIILLRFFALIFIFCT